MRTQLTVVLAPSPGSVSTINTIITNSDRGMWDRIKISITRPYIWDIVSITKRLLRRGDNLQVPDEAWKVEGLREVGRFKWIRQYGQSAVIV